MKTLKDWTKQIEDLPTMEITPLTELYTDMLATAHDIGYKVPDELLVETENPDELRKVIEPLDKGIKEFHAEAAKAKPAVVKKVTVAKKATITKAAPKKPAEPAVQKGKKEKTMAKAAKAAAEPKASKKAAKKSVAKKASKKAASSNARVGVSRFTGDEVITLKIKENPAKKGSGKYDRMANLMKHGGKKVSQFLKSSLGRSSTLHNASKAGYITIK
jgi:hypothetical protein